MHKIFDKIQQYIDKHTQETINRQKIIVRKAICEKKFPDNIFNGKR